MTDNREKKGTPVNPVLLNADMLLQSLNLEVKLL